VTSAVVIDASVAITFLLRQRGVEGVDRKIEKWLAEGAQLAVPTHFWLEVSNALLRRHRLGGVQLMETIHKLDALELETIQIDRPLLLLALDRAERFGLTTYDAAYLAVADLLDGMLFTADRALLSAAGRRGVPAAGAADQRLSEERLPYASSHGPTWPDYADAPAFLAKLRAEASRPA
jgi:predicted nucleic acid-binding protein